MALSTPRRAALSLIGLAACSSALQSAGEFREQNRKNLERLVPGMSRAEVVAVMGTESLRPLGTEGGGMVDSGRDTMGVTQVRIPVGGGSPSLYNPMRTALYEGEDSTWEVLFYYVRMEQDDGVVTDDELEPIVLRNGFLAGNGWDYWRETARRAGLSIDPPSG